MSDGITEARRGTYFQNDKYNHDDSIINYEAYHKLKSTKDIKLNKEIKDFKHMPNQKWHKIISFIKSSIRITGYILIPFDLTSAAFVLIFSEIVGILEEVV
jgi:hypothetical protein